jgi:hypothetical protein
VQPGQVRARAGRPHERTHVVAAVAQCYSYRRTNESGRTGYQDIVRRSHLYSPLKRGMISPLPCTGAMRPAAAHPLRVILYQIRGDELGLEVRGVESNSCPASLNCQSDSFAKAWRFFSRYNLRHMSTTPGCSIETSRSRGTFFVH